MAMTVAVGGFGGNKFGVIKILRMTEAAQEHSHGSMEPVEKMDPST
jgi:hypothetical protein